MLWEVGVKRLRTLGRANAIMREEGLDPVTASEGAYSEWAHRYWSRTVNEMRLRTWASRRARIRRLRLMTNPGIGPKTA